MGGTTSNWQTRKLHTPSLKWLADFLSMYSAEEITLPGTYRDRVISVKDMLDYDTSGMACSVLDFCINCALVGYSVETSNSNLTTILNNWLGNVNSVLRGKIPVGIEALAKEYFRERWKGSSLLLLRTLWEKHDDLILPTKLWFVEGEDIEIDEGKDEAVRLGEYKYNLKIGKRKSNPIPSGKEELIFVQKPYESWGCKYPVPYLVKRGVWRNVKFLELLEKKGEKVVGRALEYLMLLKKGTERMALDGGPDMVYDEKDLKKANADFKAFLANRKTTKGTDFYATNFDTEIEHLIPEYKRILQGEIYSPIEKRIMSGLGLVEIREGIAGTRRESIINPKPMVAEIKQGVADFKTLLQDIVVTIIEKNINSHRKYFAEGKLFKIHNTPVKEFVTYEAKRLLRSMYDRGRLSSQTFVELVGEVDWTIEVKRREQETKDGIDEKLFPPVTDNREGVVEPETVKPEKKDKKDLEDLDKKTKPEKKEFREAKDKGEVVCLVCETIFDLEAQEGNNKIICPACGEELVKEKKLEQAPYTKKNYPSTIKNLPVGARNIWINTFNAVYSNTHNETQARQAAWNNVKNKYKKIGDKWVRKTTKGEEENE